jgi:hypothetical protein
MLTLIITPQTVLFNNEDFHSVKIFETVVRQSEVLAHRKKLLFCKVTPVSIQTFVEGMLRFANVLEVTNGTLKNVNNICTLAINSTKYYVVDICNTRHRILVRSPENSTKQ